MQKIKTDIIIIGSGIAGLTAALKASAVANVVLCTKSHIKESNTQMAQGGIAAVWSAQDKPQYHYEDTMNAGAGLCISEAVDVLVHDGPERVRELISMGADFDRFKTGFSLTKEGAHSKRRILHAKDNTGEEIENTLVSSIKKNKRITVLENTFAKDLVVENGTVTGVVAVKTYGEEIVHISSKAVLIASGGLGQVYSNNTNPAMATGDGIAMAYRAGAAVSDMEFIQFHPTTLVSGDRKPVSLFLISEAVRGEGARLINGEGYRFMPDYHPQAELAPRDIVSRSIYDQMRKNKNKKHGVYLDLSYVKEDISTRFPKIYQRCLENGFDITREPIPVAPAAHYIMGGIKIDLSGQTTLPGLYAAGEVSTVGVHGANRLASNSLLDGLVFAARAIEHALKNIQQKELSNYLLEPLESQTLAVSTITRLREKIRKIMWNNVGIIRNKNSLKKAILKLEEIRKEINFYTTDHKLCEVQNLLENAELIAMFALERKESRGAHFREDFPGQDPIWQTRMEKTIRGSYGKVKT